MRRTASLVSVLFAATVAFGCGSDPSLLSSELLSPVTVKDGQLGLPGQLAGQPGKLLVGETNRQKTNTVSLEDSLGTGKLGGQLGLPGQLERLPGRMLLAGRTNRGLPPGGQLRLRGPKTNTVSCEEKATTMDSIRREHDDLTAALTSVDSENTTVMAVNVALVSVRNCLRTLKELEGSLANSFRECPQEQTVSRKLIQKRSQRRIKSESHFRSLMPIGLSLEVVQDKMKDLQKMNMGDLCDDDVRGQVQAELSDHLKTVNHHEDWCEKDQGCPDAFVKAMQGLRAEIDNLFSCQEKSEAMARIQHQQDDLNTALSSVKKQESSVMAVNAALVSVNNCLEPLKKLEESLAMLCLECPELQAASSNMIQNSTRKRIKLESRLPSKMKIGLSLQTLQEKKMKDLRKMNMGELSDDDVQKVRNELSDDLKTVDQHADWCVNNGGCPKAFVTAIQGFPLDLYNLFQPFVLQIVDQLANELKLANEGHWEETRKAIKTLRKKLFKLPVPPTVLNKVLAGMQFAGLITPFMLQIADQLANKLKVANKDNWKESSKTITDLWNDLSKLPLPSSVLNKVLCEPIGCPNDLQEHPGLDQKFEKIYRQFAENCRASNFCSESPNTAGPRGKSRGGQLWPDSRTMSPPAPRLRGTSPRSQRLTPGH